MSMLENKKLLVLGGSFDNIKYIKAAREMGVYTISTDVSEDSPAKHYSNEKLDISVFDTGRLIQYCKENNVDGVINFSNTFSQISHQKIAEALGFPAYGDNKQVRSFTEKKAFKSMCRLYDVDVIPEYSVEDIKERKVRFPVVVKPDDNSGSRGITTCYNYEDLALGIAYAQENSTSGDILIEKSMIGHDDLNVFYFVNDGEPYLIDVEDRYMGKKENGMERNDICSVSPSKHLSMYLQYVNKKVVNMIKKSGIKNAPIFMQGFVDGDKVRFYDPGIRFPGGTYTLVYKMLNNVDLMKAVIKYSLLGKTGLENEDFFEGYLLKNKRKILEGVYAKDGVIGEIRGCGEIMKLPEVYSLVQLKNDGDIIKKTGDIQQRVLAIGMLFDNGDDIKKTLEKVHSLLSVTDSNGKDMILNQIQANAII